MQPQPSPLTRALTLAIRGYQRTWSAVFPPTCRYWPSCSEYAIEALQLHGPARGSWLALKRVCRCHPWGGHGLDPVPIPERMKNIIHNPELHDADGTQDQSS